MINGFMGQLQGPFKANEDLYKKIKDNARTDFEFVSHLGIQVEKDTMVNINGKSFQVGRTGIYEVGNTEITALHFEEDTDEYSLIDYTLYVSEEEN